MASLDSKRYGNWITTDYAVRKNEEAYEHVYILHHPHEECPTCWSLRTGPAYDRQKAHGAQFGCVNGFERPNYFGPLDADDNFDHDARSFRRGEWWQAAMAEAKAIREEVGLIDATAFTKHMVKGPGAAQFLDWFTCNKPAQNWPYKPNLCAHFCWYHAYRIYDCSFGQRYFLPCVSQGLDRS